MSAYIYYSGLEIGVRNALSTGSPAPTVTTTTSSGPQGIAEYEVRMHDLVRQLGFVESGICTPGMIPKATRRRCICMRWTPVSCSSIKA